MNRTPTRRDRSLRRLLMLLGWSLALHLAVGLVTAKLPRPPPPPRIEKPIEVQVVEAPAPPPAPEAPPAPKPKPKPPRHERSSKTQEVAQAPVVAPQSSPLPPETAPSSVDPEMPTDESAPDQGGAASTEGGDEEALAERARGVRLFDAGALGQVVARRGSPAENAPELLSKAQKSEGAEAEEARVGSRLAGFLDAALREGEVRGGLISDCADGLDQGFDDEIDCAAPGCMGHPFCAGTQILRARVQKAIPDDDLSGVESVIDVPRGGTVRALSIRLSVDHPHPGDMAILLVAPDGRRAIVRQADRSERHFPRAFYVREFVGKPVPGRWRLHVIDAVPGGSGTLRDWQIVVTG